jgi:hypothetical protein
MQYFDQSADKYEKLGKVIGDIISAIIVVGFIVIFVYIPRSRHNPKILWIDDAEIVGDRIT